VGLSAILREARAAHFESFVLLIGASLSLQAALSVWVLVFRPQRERA